MAKMIYHPNPFSGRTEFKGPFWKRTVPTQRPSAHSPAVVGHGISEPPFRKQRGYGRAWWSK